MNPLLDFVKESLAGGHSRDEIRTVLSQANWPLDEIDDALSRFSDVAFPIPVPTPRRSGSARDAFLYLVTFVALYTTGIALGALLFGIVDHFLPDPLDQSGYQSDGLRWNIATLIVAFPLYMGLTRMHLHSYVRDPERRTSAVRRWLTYLTLFVAADVVIGTLIALIGEVLGGNMAAPFLLKCLITLLLSGAVFSFYMWELRFGDKEAQK